MKPRKKSTTTTAPVRPNDLLGSGGPAFPFTGPIDLPGAKEAEVALPGMMLRDYFAAQAMAALIPGWDGLAGDEAVETTMGPVFRIAVSAYQLADEMLKVRLEDHRPECRR